MFSTVTSIKFLHAVISSAKDNVNSAFSSCAAFVSKESSVDSEKDPYDETVAVSAKVSVSVSV